MSLARMEITDPRWLELISGNREALIFHHPAWCAVVSECYGYQAWLGAVLGENGSIVAGIPVMEVESWLTGRRAVALPFSDFCPPLATTQDALKELIQGLLDSRSGTRTRPLEIRWQLPEWPGLTLGNPVLRHVTPLARQSSEVFARLKPGMRQKIRQAEKAGLEVRICKEWNDMEAFYRLHLHTRQRLGVPVQSLRYFRLLWEKLVSREHGFVAMAYKGQVPIAGAVMLTWNRTVTYKYGASLSEYWQLRPNNLLLWNAIRWGSEHGYEAFDWGRTDLEDEGLRKFKQDWASEEQVLHYMLLSGGSTSARRIAPSRRLLPRIIQHSPTWVARSIGALMYKHFG